MSFLKRTYQLGNKRKQKSYVTRKMVVLDDDDTRRTMITKNVDADKRENFLLF